MDLEPAGWQAAASAADIAFLIDARGQVLDFAVNEADLSASLLGRQTWPRQPWQRLFAPASQAAIHSLLAAPAASGPLLALHPASEEVELPVLYQALRLGEDGLVALFGRNLLNFDPMRVALLPDLQALTACISALLVRGTPARAICLDVLAPTARRLGQAWMEDRCTHAEVIEASWRIGVVLRSLPAPQAGGTGPSILLAPAQGETHLLGLEMTAAFFRWAGWEVTIAAAGDDPISLARNQPFAVAGLSLARAEELPALRRQIEALRQSSANRGMVVLVGGAAFLGRHDLADSVRADGAATDAADAVRLATLLTEPARAAHAVGRRSRTSPPTAAVGTSSSPTGQLIRRVGIDALI